MFEDLLNDPVIILLGLNLFVVTVLLAVYLFSSYGLIGRIRDLKRDQTTIAKFLLKQYEDRLGNQIKERLQAGEDLRAIGAKPAKEKPAVTVTPTLNTMPEKTQKAIVEMAGKAADQVKPKREQTQAQKDALARGRAKRDANRAAKAKPEQTDNGDNDEELARLLESHGYQVTRGSAETLKAIKQVADK